MLAGWLLRAGFSPAARRVLHASSPVFCTVTGRAFRTARNPYPGAPGASTTPLTAVSHTGYIPDMTKTKHLGVRLHPDEYAALAALAAEQDRPLSWLVRRIVLDWLAAQERLRPKKRGAKP